MVHGEQAYIYLQLTLVASVNLAVWCEFSETVCDLSNKMTLIGDWDPDIVFSPIQLKVPDPVYVEPLVPLAPTRAMTVKVPTTSLGQGDCFLDNIIKVYLVPLAIIKENATSVSLATHVLMRPLATYELLPRNNAVWWVIIGNGVFN